MTDTKYEPREDEVKGSFLDNNGKEIVYYNEEKMLAHLLVEGECFINTRKYVCIDESIQPQTIVVFVICNDLFYWASADAESITSEELPELYEMFIKDKKWGTSKWCCKKRNMKPQVPIIKRMKEENVWEEWMNDLETPSPS